MKKIIFSLAAMAPLLIPASNLLAEDAVSPAVDLSVSATDLKITPATYKGGDKITLKATIANAGTAKAANVKVKFFFNGVEVYSKNIASISKKSKSVVTYKYTLPLNLSGTVIFKAVADPDNAISESSEDNNAAQMNANVSQAKIDLIIDSVKTSVAKPKAGQKVSIQVKVKSTGNTKATNVKLNVYLGGNIGTPDFTVNIPSINKNSISAKSFSWTVPNSISGTNYPIKAVADPDNAIVETNELNNDKTYLLNLTAPDLALEQQDLNYKPKFTYTGLNTMMNLRLCNDNVAYFAIDTSKLSRFRSDLI